MNWYVYICKARTGRYYVGITTDPTRRLKKHNSGNGSKLAREQGPFEFAYVSKPFENKSSARKREIQLKGWTKIKKEMLISGKWD